MGPQHLTTGLYRMIDRGQFLNTTNDDQRNYFNGSQQRVEQQNVGSLSLKSGLYRLEGGVLQPAVTSDERPAPTATPEQTKESKS